MTSVFCLFGKRKSGKDFCAEVMKTMLNEGNSRQNKTEIRRISDPLKEEYANLKGLTSSEELKTSGPLKEIYRAEMIEFGENIRNKDCGYFCRKAVESLPSSTKFLIISDCRRPTDLQFFKATFPHVIIVKIKADIKTRAERGFVHCPEIDEAESECALDGWEDVDAVIDNSSRNENGILQNQIMSILKKYINAE